MSATDYPTGIALPDWQPREAPSTSAIVGQYCELRALDVNAHAAALYSAMCTAEGDHNWIYLPYGPFQSSSTFHEWLNAVAKSDDPLFHTIIDVATGEPCGLASFLRIDPAVGSIEVGHIHFGNTMQRTPIATEAMYLMMCRVFDELGYRRYEWKCDALNARSRQAAERIGFTFEGIFRQATIYKGRNRDTAWYSIIDGEWPAIKQAFENWLAADNFDATGQQRDALRCRAE